MTTSTDAACRDEPELGAVRDCCPSVLSAPLGADAAEELSLAFTALADPVRLRVISLIAGAPDGEVCVCDFVGPLGKSQPTISHHLKILSEAGIVHGDRRGRWVWYSLDHDRLGSLRDALADPAPAPSRAGSSR